MGLDSYLKKRIYVGANYTHNAVSGRITIKKEGKHVKVNFKRVSEITEDVGYWRKANHIHKWFVDNCQNGEDDCRDAYVSKEQLIDLLNTCKKVLEIKEVKKSKRVKAEIDERPEELLPTQSGLFFGGTELDEYYYEAIKNTIEIIEPLLKELSNNDSIYYQSSW